MDEPVSVNCNNCLCNTCIWDLDECPEGTDCAEEKCTVKTTCKSYEHD